MHAEECSLVTQHLSIDDCREGLLLTRCMDATVDDCSIETCQHNCLCVVDSLNTTVRRCRMQTQCLQRGTALSLQGVGSPCVRHCRLDGRVVLLEGSQAVLHHNRLAAGLRIARAGPSVLDNSISGLVVLDHVRGVLAHNDMQDSTIALAKIDDPSMCFNNLGLSLDGLSAVLPAMM